MSYKLILFTIKQRKTKLNMGDEIRFIIFFLCKTFNLEIKNA